MPYDDLDFTIPQGAKEEARRGLDWVSEHNRGGTSVGRNSARYILNNTKAGPAKVRHIAKYFPRHESDKTGQGWSPGEDNYPSNGRIAWALWGGEAGKRWSTKLVNAMNARDEKVNTALELIERRNHLRQMEIDKRTTRFESIEVKERIWTSYDMLLENWDFTLGQEYYQLLSKQVKGIVKIFAEQGTNTSGVTSIVNSYIDRNTTKDWSNTLIDIYQSQILDFAYFEIELLMPKELKVTVDNTVFSPSEQEQLMVARRRKPRAEVIQDGFYPLRKRGVPLPINTTVYNRNANKFVKDRLDTLLPEMSKTMKNNVNRALRKSYDEAIKLGLTGKDFDKYMRNGIADSLGKKNLGRAMNIARTEGTALSNWGMEESAKGTNLILSKEWITRRDGLVRDSHLFMDNVRVGQDSTFNVQGYAMKRPGDSSGGAPAGLVCNCRCTLVFHEEKI